MEVMTVMKQPKYKRIVLKLSGEALAGDSGFGFVFIPPSKSTAKRLK